MNDLPLLVIVLANALVLAFGGFITRSVLRASRRTGSRDLRYLAVGFGLVTLSMLLGGGMHLIAGDVLYGVATRAIVTALGFGVILYSLLLRNHPRQLVARASDPREDGS